MRLIFAGLIAIAGVAMPLWLMRHGINYQDEPYQMLNAAEYGSTPFAPGSALAGYIWSSIFGFNLLSFRVLSVICMLGSMAIPAIYLYRRGGGLSTALAVFGVGAMWITLIPAKGYLYSWDSLSTLCLSATAVASLSYANRPSMAKAVAIGCLAALATLARVPDAAVILVGIFVVTKFAPKEHRRTYLPICILVFIITFGLIALIIFLSQGQPPGSLPDNIITGHSTDMLLAGYERTFIPAVEFSILSCTVVLCMRLLPNWVAAFLLTAALIAGCQLPIFPLATTANFLSIGLLVASLIIYRYPRWSAAIVVMIALCATCGSDMGFEKVITLQSVILLSAELSPERRKSLLLAGGVMYAVVAWVEVPAQGERTFEDQGFCHTTHLVTSTPFAGVYTTEERAGEITKIDSIAKDWQARGGDILVIGDCFRYGANLAGGVHRLPAIRHAYLIDTNEYFRSVNSYINAHVNPNNSPQHELMVISSRPFDWRQPHLKAPDLRINMAGFQVADTTPSFTIFTKCANLTPER